MIHRSPSGFDGRGAFTLIELLVVVAIVALLIGILLPTIGRARDSARAAVCLSNLRQIGAGFSMYADASKDFVPREAGRSEPWPAVPPYYTSWAFGIRPFIDPNIPASGDPNADPDAGGRDQFRNAPYYRDPARRGDDHPIHYVNNGLSFTRFGRDGFRLNRSPKGPTEVFRSPRPVLVAYLTCFADDPGNEVYATWYSPGSTNLQVSIFYDMGSGGNITGGVTGPANDRRRVAVDRHGKGANAVYLDAHAAFIPNEALTTLATWNDGDYTRNGVRQPWN